MNFAFQRDFGDFEAAAGIIFGARPGRELWHFSVTLEILEGLHVYFWHQAWPGISPSLFQRDCGHFGLGNPFRG